MERSCTGLLVKAGQILSAMSASGEEGAAALAAVSARTRAVSSVVYRRREFANEVPLAPLRMLLLDGDRAEDATSPVPAAAPVAWPGGAGDPSHARGKTAGSTRSRPPSGPTWPACGTRWRA